MRERERVVWWLTNIVKGVRRMAAMVFVVGSGRRERKEWWLREREGE
jgi:hypothetical protein